MFPKSYKLRSIKWRVHCAYLTSVVTSWPNLMQDCCPWNASSAGDDFIMAVVKDAMYKVTDCWSTIERQEPYPCVPEDCWTSAKAGRQCRRQDWVGGRTRMGKAGMSERRVGWQQEHGEGRLGLASIRVWQQQQALNPCPFSGPNPLA